MLSKPDLKHLPLQGKTAKDRLVKVWSVIDKLDWIEKKEKIITKLEKEMPANKGDVSAFLAGKREMSTNFFQTFIEKYDCEQPDSLETTNGHAPDAAINDTAKSLVNLSDANKETATANRILAENQRDLIEILKVLHKPTVDAALSNPPNPSYVVQPFLDRIAQYGIDRKWWKTFDEGRVVLGKLAHEVSTVKQE